MRLAPALLLAIAAVAVPVDARIVHAETSLYHNILVVDDGSQRCMQFTYRADHRNQSCVNLERPRQLVFHYTRMMLAALLLDPSPSHVLIIGLGGGTLPGVLAQLYPDARIDVVEIDPAVVRVARQYFDFAPGANVRVIENDGRVWVKRAANAPLRYDLIMLDAFRGEYIPEHLMTREFLGEARELLADGGVLVANTFYSTRLYDHESATYAAVFGTFFNFRSKATANRIIVARRGPLPDEAALRASVRLLRVPLLPYGVPIEDYPQQLSTRQDWDTTARVLTDQYSPANLLKGR